MLKSIFTNLLANTVPSDEFELGAFLSALVVHLPVFSFWNGLGGIFKGSLPGDIKLDGRSCFDTDAGGSFWLITILPFVFAAVDFPGNEPDLPPLSEG